ncbi:MAG: hypothetical protein KDC38_06550 [Planctomycetes bacterium]|nr:hypothetical protein [Planctomycetota bacterium]
MRITRRMMFHILLPAMLVALPAPSFAQAPVAADLVVIEGQAAGGDFIDVINSPFCNGNGRVGFTGSLASGDRFVWFDSGVSFLASSALPLVLTGGESTMGVSNAGGFIYSPAADGQDAVYTNNGLLLAELMPAPGLPGLFSSFNSRPTMEPDGTCHWVGGFTDVAGGSTQGRVLYESTNEGLGTPNPILASGMMVGGFTIGASGVDFDYDFSDTSTHWITVIDAASGERFVVVDGAVGPFEGDPTGGGDNWGAFDIVSINDSGTFVFSGDTDGVAATDEFIAVDGVIALREGDIVDGVTLTGSVNALSVDNTGLVAHIWDLGTPEALFVGSASDLLGTTMLLLQTGDLIDVDGNGVGDWRVTDFNASAVIGPGLDLRGSGDLYVEVDLEDPVTLGAFEAIIRLDVTGGPLTTEFIRGYCNADGGFDISDAIFLLSVLFTGGASPTCDASCDMNVDGALDIADAVSMLTSLFVGGSVQPPFPDCGESPTEDCGSFTCP